MAAELSAGPKTYQSAWQYGENGTAVLLTAEDWLAEEAEVDAALDQVDGPNIDSGPSRAGILRAIAAEIAALRAEKAVWAESYTRLTREKQEAEQILGDVRDMLDRIKQGVRYTEGTDAAFVLCINALVIQSAARASSPLEPTT